MNLRNKMMIAGCCIAALGSCKKDKPAPDNFIFYKLNGVYTTIKPEADIFDDSSFLLEAGPFNKNEIGLFVDSNIQVRTYHFENAYDNAVGDYYDGKGAHFWSDSGTLVIKSFDGYHIKGSFSFRAKTEDSAPATIRITEGQFSTDVGYFSSSPDTCTLCDSTIGVSKRGLLVKHLARARISIPIHN